MLAQISWLCGNASHHLRQVALRFGEWWLQEFLSLWPARVAQWLTDPGNATLLLLQDDAFAELSLKTGIGTELDHTHVPHSEYGANLIDELLQRYQLRRGDVTIGIGLPSHQFFQRKLLLPLQAGNSVSEIVVHDLAQKTPFDLTDIHHDYIVVPEAGKLSVTQHVIRRDSVGAAASSFGLESSDIDFVEAVSPGDGSASPARIALHPEATYRTFWIRRAATALAISALLLALIAGGLKYWRQETALDLIDAEMVTARQQAQQVRAAFAKLEQRQKSIIYVFTKKRNEPTLLDIWGEVTRLLPADAWLTELRVTAPSTEQERQISMSGFSGAAAKLVAVLDRSPVFQDAALTTAIALDQTEQRERFALQAKIRNHELRDSDHD
jgi:general secretion pathway protein L